MDRIRTLKYLTRTSPTDQTFVPPSLSPLSVCAQAVERGDKCPRCGAAAERLVPKSRESVAREEAKEKEKVAKSGSSVMAFGNPEPLSALDLVDLNLGFAALCFFLSLAGIAAKGALESGEPLSLDVVAGPAAFAAVWDGIVANQRSPIEDVCLSGLFVCTLYSLYKLFAVRRKSLTLGTTLHVLTGAGAFLTSLYAIGLERAFRISPGWGWCWASALLYTANSLSWFPLIKIFRGSAESKYAFYLAYSFVVSFQGVQLIAWAAQPDAPDWMYWAVMPFWWWSIRKLGESGDFILALLPEETISSWPAPLRRLAEGSKERIPGIQPDAATLSYTGLNVAAALFDNSYMLLFTLLGPTQFWHTSMMFCANDFHLRLLKADAGSLTVSVLVFLSTVAIRRQMPWNVIIALNVLLGSTGPWVVLLWHKILDWNEYFFPQFVFDPAYDYHIFDIHRPLPEAVASAAAALPAAAEAAAGAATAAAAVL